MGASSLEDSTGAGGGLNYEQAGVNYDRLDAFKRACQRAAATTTGPTAPPAQPTGTWQSADVGGVAVTGSATESGGVLTLIGSGDDIWSTGDEFRFRHQPWTGDGEIVARLTGLTNTHAWAKAGVMFRNSLNANSKQASVVMTPSNGIAFVRRTSTGGGSSSTFVSGSTSSYFCKPRTFSATHTGELDIPPPSQLNPHIPPDLDATVMKALAEDPGNDALVQLLKASYGQKSALVRQVSAS